MAHFGYHGKYLHIPLGDVANATPIPLSETTLRKSVGGVGLGAHLLLQENAPEQDAFDSPLAFVFSPLVGSPITTSAKFAVVCKSPLTDRFNDALASSGFAIRGKATGHDALLITGKASRPSILVIDNEEVRLETAEEVWGKSTTQTESILRRQFGSEFDFAVIGPAGENRVRFASLSHDGRHAGRGGTGAVLGAKRIKAIAVRGTKKCMWFNPTGLSEFAKALSQKSFGPATAKYRELGTASNLLAFNRLRTLPTRNFQQSTFEAAESLAPETLVETREKTRASCRSCTIGCEHLYSLGGDQKKVRLEYENLFALGPLCGVSDSQAVLAASQRCDELGIDTISAGGTIAFAMECVERELLEEPWLQFGSGEAVLRAIEMIATRLDICDQMAEGTRRFAEQIGGEAPRFASHVKGMEIPGYEPRSLQTMALGFAVGARGADHNRSSAYEVDFSEQANRHQISTNAVSLAAAAEDRAVLLDTLILCKFLRRVFDDIWTESANMLQLVTGWDMSAEELKEVIHRIINAKKQFNIQCGWSPAEDTLPDRFFDDDLPETSNRVSREQLKQAIREYNRQRGWTDDGFIE